VKLVVLSAGMTGRVCELKVDKTTIGRSEDNVFQIADPSVSSHHCEVLVQGNEVLVRDLNSTNGSYINGAETKEGVVKPGQILRLGQIEMRLESAAPATAATPGKQQFDRTRVIPGGVNQTDLDQSHRGGTFDTRAAGFSKRTNKVNQMFIIGGVVFAVIIGVLLLYIFSTIRK
jgi:hypothetical protein